MYITVSLCITPSPKLFGYFFCIYTHLHRSSPCSLLSKEVKRPKSDVVHVGNVDSDPPPRSLGPSVDDESVRSQVWFLGCCWYSKPKWLGKPMFVCICILYVYIYSKQYIYKMQQFNPYIYICIYYIYKYINFLSYSWEGKNSNALDFSFCFWGFGK